LQAINRRQFLRRSGLACASIAPFAALSRTLLADGHSILQSYKQPLPIQVPRVKFDAPVRDLPRVHVTDERVMKTIVGLRPYRPSGFVVRAEKVDDTLVVHNYGHGGGGITLSWGTAQLALQIGCPGHTGPVAVIGCGAVGLASARLLQEAGYTVTIYTKALPAQTTSYIAGGEWFPFLVASAQQSDARFNQQLLAATEFAYKRYQTMLGTEYGVRWIRNYCISKKGFNENGAIGMQSMYRSMMPEFRDLQPADHPFADGNAVRQFDTLLIEPPTYLPAMMNAFRQASGTVIVRDLTDRNAIAALPEKLVFNCTGMGAKDLFADQELTPVRGQLTFLKPQPEVQYGVSHDELYMLPRTEGILLGGTYELGVNSVVPDMERKNKILARHKAFFDGYKRRT